jgi:hypothetical protein
MLMHTSFFYDKECQNSEKMCRNDRKNSEKCAEMIGKIQKNV